MSQNDILRQIKELAGKFQVDVTHLLEEFSSSSRALSEQIKHLEMTQVRTKELRDLAGQLENPTNLEVEFWKKIASEQKDRVRTLGTILLEREKMIRQLSRSHAVSFTLFSHILLRQITFTRELIENYGEDIIAQSTDKKVIRHDLRYIINSHMAWERALTKIHFMFSLVKEHSENYVKLQVIFSELQKYTTTLKKRSQCSPFPIFQVLDPGDIEVFVDSRILLTILKELIYNASVHNIHVKNIHLKFRSIPKNPQHLYVFVMQDEPVSNPFHFSIGNMQKLDNGTFHIPVGLGAAYILSFLISPEGIQQYSFPHQHGFYLLVRRS